ncbi:MAG: hypothetical protein IT336_10745 [Thermomicrobiales bacterium]|nr:hypothetical protein [Thermomicrobiales bacterium]
MATDRPDWRGGAMGDMGMDAQLPPYPWRLSAPESLVLLWGPEAGNAWALKVALLELVVRRVLRLSSVERSRLFRSPEQVNMLGPGEQTDWPAPRPLVAVLDVYAGTRPPADGVSVVALATAVFRRNVRRVRTGFLRHRMDRTGGGYVDADVLTVLERQGYYTPESAARLGLVRSTRWHLTPSGERARDELKQFMALGRSAFPDWVTSEPELARSYVERAGPAMLLLGGVAPLLRSLHAQERTRRRDERDDGFGLRGNPFQAAALAGSFGPEPNDDLDAAFFAISEDVDRAWRDHQQGDGGGLIIFGGE